MKRRDAIRLLPLSIAGIASLTQTVHSGDMRTKDKDKSSGVPLASQYTKKIRERQLKLVVSLRQRVHRRSG